MNDRFDGVKPLIHLIYASSETQAPSAQMLDEILRASRINNEQRGVTGMLLYSEGSFFQVLEGDVDAVDALFARIARDARHQGVVTIIRERITKRAFAEWSMGFVRAAREELREVPGFNDFFATSTCFEALDSGRAKKLLAAFRNNRWRVSAPSVSMKSR